MRKFSFVLAIVMVMTLVLSACAPEAEPEPTEEPTEEEVGAPFEGVEVTFWHPYSEGPGEAMQGLIDEFNASNEYGIIVEGLNQGTHSDVEDKINAGIQSGDLPNVAIAYTNSLSDWYTVGSVVDLNPYIQDEEYGLTQEELEDLYPHLREIGTTPDGAWVAYPITQSANVLVYNFTWAQELGFDSAPATSAELREQLCAAAAANDETGGDFAGTGGMVYFPSTANWLNFVYAFGGDELNDEGTAYDFNSQAAIDATMFINGMKEDGCVWEVDGYPNPEQGQRKALVTLSSTAGLYYYEVAFEDAENDDEWGFIAAPGPDGNLAVDAYQQMLGVFASTEDEQMASWLFIKWLTSPEIQARWVQGADGYYGTQYTTEALLAEFGEENPVWATGVELAALGPAEPQTFPAWSAVRSAVGDAAAQLYSAADEAEISAILDELTTTANELVEEVQ